MFRNRSAVEIMVLIFTVTVAAVIMLSALAIIFVNLLDPLSDTDSVTNSLLNVITGILGALLGLLAGKAESNLSQRPDGTPADLTDRKTRPPPPLEEPP